MPSGRHCCLIRSDAVGGQGRAWPGAERGHRAGAELHAAAKRSLDCLASQTGAEEAPEKRVAGTGSVDRPATVRRRNRPTAASRQSPATAPSGPALDRRQRDSDASRMSSCASGSSAPERTSASSSFGKQRTPRPRSNRGMFAARPLQERIGGRIDRERNLAPRRFGQEVEHGRARTRLEQRVAGDMQKIDPIEQRIRKIGAAEIQVGGAVGQKAPLAVWREERDKRAGRQHVVGGESALDAVSGKERRLPLAICRADARRRKSSAIPSAASQRPGWRRSLPAAGGSRRAGRRRARSARRA